MPRLADISDRTNSSSMKSENDIWQVMTGGEVYQADLETLKEWISEGLVGQTDSVRKGNLKWIEAGRAPLLRRVFNGEEKIVPREASTVAAVAVATAEVSATDAHVPHQVAEEVGGDQSFQETLEESEEEPFLIPVPTQHAAVPVVAASCYNHPNESPEYVCRSCAATFCRHCTKRVDNSAVALCALCGELCRRFDELKQQHELYEEQSAPFGFADFTRSLAYPFKHTISLVFGAALYAFMLLAGMRGRVLAFAILFGCISIVINRVAAGKFDRDFLPDFSAFSFLDDVLMPALLGVGVTIVALGPAILLVLLLLFGWLGGLKGQTTQAAADARYQEMRRKAGEEANRIAGEKLNSEEIQKLAGGTQEEQQVVLNKLRRAEMEDAAAKKKDAAISEKVEESDDGHDMTVTFALQFLKRPGFILLLGLLAVGWAIFYYPMALAVAGYTEDFKS
ncbi:MAG: hypothetical protein WCD76_04565, partial [Pyrinomonadaceae bacterium]